MKKLNRNESEFLTPENWRDPGLEQDYADYELGRISKITSVLSNRSDSAGYVIFHLFYR